MKSSAPLRLSTPVRPRLFAVAGLVAAAIITGIVIAGQTNRTPADNDLAMLTTAANNGESGAELQLGLAWREGRLGLTADETKAHYWIHRAALDGNNYAAALEGAAPAPTAMQKVAGFFSDIGSIFSRSSTTTLTEEAEAGDAQAQYQLAMRYRDGSLGVARDDAASRLWLERAAKAGDKVAMTTLAHAYETGVHGFPRDNQQAALWQQRASAIN